jgi:hypothetical protein
MIRTLKTFILTLVIGTIATLANTAFAVSPKETIKNYNEEIRLAIINTIGSKDETVELVIADHIFKVLRVNTNMLKSNHQGVNNEATAIASVVSKTIADKPEYKDILAIRVEYVKRSGSSSKNKVIDSVNFRKNQNGVFELHIT